MFPLQTDRLGELDHYRVVSSLINRVVSQSQSVGKNIPGVEASWQQRSPRNSVKFYDRRNRTLHMNMHLASR